MDDESGSDFSQPWLRPTWRAEAMAWIERELDRLGLRVTGEVEQPHLRWWSTVLRVPTTDGVLWFKATQPAGVFETRLTPLLAAEWPDAITQMVATDRERGWMLSRDAGVRLRELDDGLGPVEHWERLLPRYAEIQIRLASRREELLELGVPDLGLSVLPGELAAALGEPSGLLLGEEGGLTDQERARLVVGEPDFADLCQRLRACGIPETLQHDDLHDGNLFVRDGSYLFFDWGDSCLSHPFHTLVVTLRGMAYRHKWEPGGPEVTRLRDAYLEAWAAFGAPADLVVAADLARRTGTVQRALAWRRFLSGLPPAVRAEDADSVPYGLRLYLLDGPWGSWDDGSF